MSDINVLSRTQRLVVEPDGVNNVTNVLSRTQRIIVESNKAVSVTNAGPPGPQGPPGVDADLALIVHKAGAEEITGLKTFTLGMNVGTTTPAALRGAGMLKIVPPDAVGMTDEASGIIMQRPSSAWGSAAGGGTADYAEGQFLAFFQEEQVGSTNNVDDILFRVDKFGGMGMAGGVHIWANAHNEQPGMAQALWINPASNMTHIAMSQVVGQTLPFLYAASASETLFQVDADGKTRIPAGTAALPSITQVANPDTGLFFPFTSQIGISISGVERVRINAAGLEVKSGWGLFTGSAYGAGVFIQPPLAADDLLVLRPVVGSTGLLTSWQNSSSSVIASMSSLGLLTLLGGIALNNVGSNLLHFNTSGVGIPALTTRSLGTKLVLYPAVTASSIDYAIGIASGTLWNSVGIGGQFQWYIGNAASVPMTLTNGGRLALPTAGSGGGFSINDAAMYRSAPGVLATNAMALYAPNSTTVPLIVQGIVSQSTPLQEWRNSAGTLQAAVNADGAVRTYAVADVGITGPYALFGPADLQIRNRSATQISLMVRGFTSQTADLQQWQNSAATVLAKINSIGGFAAVQGFFQPLVNTYPALVAKQMAGSTQSLQEWQNSTGAPVGSMSSAGGLVANFALYSPFLIDLAQGGPYLQMLSTTMVAVSRNAAQVTFTVKGAVSQTGLLQQWTNSASAVLASVSAAGLGLFAGLSITDATNVALGTTTGTKIGTATTQKLGFFNATPVVQGASVADATGGATVDAEARAAINALISRIEALGLIATI